MPGSKSTPFDISNVKGFDELSKNFYLSSSTSSDERERDGGGERDRGEEKWKGHGID